MLSTRDIIKSTVLKTAFSIATGRNATEVDGEQYNEDLIFHLILSDSTKAMLYVSSLEDEFDIEFDDDDINMTFFMDSDYVVTCIEKVQNQ